MDNSSNVQYSNKVLKISKNFIRNKSLDKCMAKEEKLNDLKSNRTISPDDDLIRRKTINRGNEVKNVQDQINRLKEAKFEDINIVDMYYVYFKLLPIEDRRRIERLELMDEFEELNLLQKHACFGYASKCKNDKFKGLITKM